MIEIGSRWRNKKAGYPAYIVDVWEKVVVFTDGKIKTRAWDKEEFLRRFEPVKEE